MSKRIRFILDSVTKIIVLTRIFHGRSLIRIATGNGYLLRASTGRGSPRIFFVSKSTHGFITHTMLERAATRTMKRITSLGNNDARARFADSEISREPAARLWFTPCNLINHQLLAIGIESSPSLAHVILRFRVLRHSAPFSQRKPNVRGSVSRRYDSTGEFLQQ